MTPHDRAQLVRIERKAFRARRAPTLTPTDSAGMSTRPWGAGRIAGIQPSFGRRGPSKRALDFWGSATGQGNPASTRRRKRGPFALSTTAL